MATFFERFSILLDENPQIKQSDIVKKAGIEKSLVHRYWNGKTIPDSVNLFKIANMFNVSPTWLMGEDVPMEIVVNNRTKTTNTLLYEGKDELKIEIANLTKQILDNTDNTDTLVMLRDMLSGVCKK